MTFSAPSLWKSHEPSLRLALRPSPWHVHHSPTAHGALMCSNHTRDSKGWPLGDCPICLDYRKRMGEWFIWQLLAGNGDPEKSPVFDLDIIHSKDNDEDYTRDDVGTTR